MRTHATGHAARQRRAAGIVRNVAAAAKPYKISPRQISFIQILRVEQQVECIMYWRSSLALERLRRALLPLALRRLSWHIYLAFRRVLSAHTAVDLSCAGCAACVRGYPWSARLSWHSRMYVDTKWQHGSLYRCTCRLAAGTPAGCTCCTQTSPPTLRHRVTRAQRATQASGDRAFRHLTCDRPPISTP